MTNSRNTELLKTFEDEFTTDPTKRICKVNKYYKHSGTHKFEIINLRH